MKKHSVLFLFVAGLAICLTIPMNASANDSLAALMRKISGDFRGIGRQISDPTKNASSLSFAQDLIVQLKLVRDEVPDSVAKLQGTDRDQAFQEFQADIDEVAATTAQLISALQNNDNTVGVAILNKISDLKKSGHLKFAQ